MLLPVAPRNLSFSAWVTWCPSHTVLRGHLSLSDTTVGRVDHLCAISRMERWLGQKGRLSVSRWLSVPPLYGGRLRLGSGMSWEPLSDSPRGYILRNWKILTLQKAWPRYKLGTPKKWPLNGSPSREGTQNFLTFSPSWPSVRIRIWGTHASCLSVACLSPGPSVSLHQIS